MALALALAGCASPDVRQDKVHDRIGEELRQSANDLRAREAAEQALLPKLQVESPAAQEKEHRFDLSVVNAPVQQVFMAIVNGTRYNMLMSPEVAGALTLNLKDVSVREALDAIREIYGYEYRIQGNRITIEPNTMQTRIFQINYLAAVRGGDSELRVTSSSLSNANSGQSTTTAGSGATSTPTGAGTSTASVSNTASRIRTTSVNDFWGGMSAALTAILGNAEGRSVVVNPLSGVIVVRALPRELRAVESYLRANQAVIERQVMLEAKIIDVQLSESYQAGINWAGFGKGNNSSSLIGGATTGTSLAANGSGVTLTTSSSDTLTTGTAGSVIASALGKGFFGLAFQTSNFAALLSFLESQGTVSVLSSPRVATLNNQKAVLKVGTDDLFVTNVTSNTTTTTTGTTSSPTVTLQSYFSGISLDVTPQIDDEGNIILHVHPAVSTVTEKEKTIDLGSQGTYTLPLASSAVNESDSIVRARDGYIVAIGGLMSQSQSRDRSGLPGTSTPLLGQRTNSLAKRELVILIKPTVIRDEKPSIADIEATEERIRGLKPLDPPL